MSMRSLAVLLLCLLPLKAYHLPRVDPGYYEVLGLTSWDCTDRFPKAVIKHDLVLTDVELAIEIATHEDMHIEQMLRYESCTAYKFAILRDSRRIHTEFEAEAYCAEAKVAVEHGRYETLLEAVEEFGSILSGAYGLRLSPEEASLKIQKYCPLPLPSDGTTVSLPNL